MKMNEEQKRVKAIFQAFQTPLILSPGGWGDELPDWFKPRIIGERLAMIDAGTYDTATDAEVTAYMFTASLAQPLTPDLVGNHDLPICLADAAAQRRSGRAETTHGISKNGGRPFEASNEGFTNQEGKGK